MFKKILRSDYAKVYYFDIVAKFFAALISIIIIRTLSVIDYSEYTYFFSISSFVSGILGSGIGLAYTSYAVELREEKENADALLYESLKKVLFVAYPAISVICFLGILYFVGGSYNTLMFGILYGMLLSFNQINIVFFQARKQYVTAGVVSNIKSILLSVMLALVMVNEWGNLLIVYVVYIISIVGSIAFTEHMIGRMTINAKSEKCDKNLLKYMVKDSVWTILYMLVISAFNQVDVMMLKTFSNEIAVANYGVAYKYYTLVISLLPAIQVVLRVNSSGIEMRNAVDRKMRVLSWLKKSTPLSFLLLIIGIMGANILFPYINGEQYNDAIVAFNVLMVGASLSYITAPNVSIMVGAKKQKILFLLSICSFLINVVGNYIFIPIGGIVAASMTTVIAHFILNGGSTLYLIVKGKDQDDSK